MTTSQPRATAVTPASTYEQRMADPVYAAYVQRIVDQAPPATDEEIRTLRALIQAGRRSRRRLPLSACPALTEQRLTA